MNSNTTNSFIDLGVEINFLHLQETTAPAKSQPAAFCTNIQLSGFFSIQ